MWTAVNANAPGVQNAGGQALYRSTGLAAGQHTLWLIKRSGVYIVVDGLAVDP